MLFLPAMRAAIRAATFLAAILAPIALRPALAQAPLTLEDAQRIAVERSRLVDAQESAAVASRQMAVAAGQLPDPVLTVGVVNVPVSGAGAFSTTRDAMTMKSVGLMQEWTRAEKRRARADRYEREADRAVAEKVATIASLERDTARAWLDRHFAEAQLAVIAEQTRQARLEVDAAEDAYRAGRGSLADLLTARSTLVGFDDKAREVRARVSAATVALARHVGEASERPLAPKPAIDALPIDRQALEAGLEHHPQIAALEQREHVAAAEVEVAQANRRPDWSWQLMYGQRGPGFPDMVSLGVSVPLPFDRSQRQDREVAARLALLDQARAERDDAIRAHRAEVRAMLVDWDANRERSARYARELLPLAQERTQAVLAAYRGAKASLADVLAARRNEIDVRLQALALEADAARAWSQLAFLVPARLPAASRGSPR